LDRGWPARGRSQGWGGDSSGVLPARSFDGYTFSMVHQPAEPPSVLNPVDYNLTQLCPTEVFFIIRPARDGIINRTCTCASP
uniref:Neur_chan_LBD domain-containing protein n=1 Tax=Heligmosomoides polygyrus TaxID=6339 RepID=A0A183GL02_HELPZ